MLKSALHAAVLALVLCSAAACLSAQTLSDVTTSELPSLLDTYKNLHAHPELSHQEEHTAALLAEALRKQGYTVTEHIGRYADGTQAHGVVAILKNGPGPQLLIRGDMDALPVTEETGVSYASHVKVLNASGQQVGVMHACGHDVHTTTLIGVANALAALKQQWHGTLMLVGQPSEETIDGARAMLADHLYERFGTPTYAVALHDGVLGPAGTVSFSSGPALSGATSVDVTLRGVSGHGAMPQFAKDPILMAAQFIVQLQSVVTRQEDAASPTVITVGDIHGGTRRNIIPPEVKMEITVRSFNEQSREIALSGIRRTADAVALAAGVPDDRAPVISVLDNESTIPLYNDPALTARAKAALTQALGAAHVLDAKPQMPSEDFPFFGLENHKIPIFMFWLNAADPAQFAAAQAKGQILPGPHNSRFEPSPEPTLRTGITAMTSLAISLLQ